MMGRFTNYFIFFTFFLLFSHKTGFAEGTKELMPVSSQDTRILVANGNVGGQPRDPFALEGGNLDYRLCIHISDPLTEKIYFGLGATNNGGTVNWRIYAPDDTQAWPTLPTITKTPIAGQPGFINTYDEAIRGPQILDPLGYDAISLVPTMAGDYYMTFEVSNTNSRTFSYFDITVVSDASGTDSAKLGRIYSKCWQISNPGPPYPTFAGKMFIYSNDGIVTKLDANNFEGRDFSFCSNESGCYKVDATHNIQQARRSQTTLHNYPEYKVFLNDPGANDVNHGDYPDGVIGNLVSGSVIPTPNCDGTITFTFETAPANALGTVEITLQLSQIVPQPIPPYADRVLQTNLPFGGIHQIVWDGKDANGVQIPSGSSFPFTLRYTNGLTHLPLWDVEYNYNGFKVNLVRPVQVPPLDDPAFYWDDSNISNAAGTVIVNPPGCTAVTGCHGWSSSWPFPYNTPNGGFGDQRTINTWWYLVSNSSDTVTITYIKSPGILVPVNPPTDVCQGGTATFSVVADPGSQQYHWIWDGGTQITALPTITITFPANATPGTSHVLVNGMNSACPDGPQLDIPFTMHALPTATITGPDPVCILSTLTYSTVASMTNYVWNVTGGSIASGQNTSQITITWNTVGPGNVTVTFSDPFGCGAASPGIKTVTVNPLPTASISGTSAVCQNSVAPLVTFTGASAVTLPYTFTYNINGGANMTISTIAGNSVTVAAPTNTVGIFTYNLISVQDATSPTPCTQSQAGSATITVNPLPTAFISATTTVCQNAPQPQITFTGAAATAPYTFTYNINGGPNQNVISVGNSAIINVPTNVTGTYTYNLISVKDGSLTACSQLQSGFATITVNPLPTASMTAVTTAVCQNSLQPQITFTGGGATAPYTFTYNINGGINQTVTSVGNIGTVNAPTNSPGIFTYNLVSVQDASSTTCSQTQSGSVTITVNPLPTANISGTTSVCQNAPFLQVTFTGGGSTAPYIFTYNINGGANQVTTSIGNIANVSVPTVTAGTYAYNLVSVKDASTLTCSQLQSGAATVTVNPLPVTTITGSITVCQDFPTLYQYQTSVIEASPATYSWQVIPGGSGTITPSAGSNPININWNTPGSATILVNAVSALGCPNSGLINVTINPKPAVSLVSCFDPVTTRSARRFQLKGGSPLYPLSGSPLQGVYISTPPTPALQTDVSGNYFFNPSVIPGNTTVSYSITYRYTNQFSCPNTTSPVTIIVQGANSPCGASMTDPRDGKVYSTALLAGRCWMTENLNYNKNLAVTPVNNPQTDNCVVEKYCPPADPTCSKYGSYYQWDELIQYGNTDIPYQGLCPPAWHVPTETEWQTLINNLDPAFTPPSANALVGSELKDPSKSFKALLEGINYLNNNIWDFTSGLTVSMYWTSTLDVSNSNRAIARGLNNPYNTSISRYSSSRANAFPVRCVKD